MLRFILTGTLICMGFAIHGTVAGSDDVDYGPWAEYSFEDIVQLRQREDDSVAIRAAWEMVVRSSPPDLDSETDAPLSHDAVERFFGFVEGRLQIRIPEWWQDVVGAGKRRRSVVVFHPSPQHIRQMLTAPGNDAFDVNSLSEGWDIDLHPQELHVIECPEIGLFTETRIPSEILGLDKCMGVGEPYGVIVDRIDETIVVGIDQGPADFYQITAINRETLEQMWSADIRLRVMGIGGSLKGYMHDNAFVQSRSTIYAIGVTLERAYLYGYDPLSGEETFSFETFDTRNLEIRDN